MKFDFWFEIPSSLCNVLKDEIEEQDLKKSQLLFSFSKKLKLELNDIHSDLSNLSIEDNSKNNIIIKKKLLEINKQEIKLLCESVKFSIHLISNFMMKLEHEGSGNNYEQRIIKLKLMIKLLSLINLKSAKGINDLTIPNGKIFFRKINTFSEKVITKLYSISKEIIRRTLEIKTLQNSMVIENFDGNRSQIHEAN